MKRFALIGRRLGHSYSQRWFEELFAREGLRGHSYSLVEMPTLEGLRDWVRRDHIDGFNVTVPYKQEIIPLLDALDETAAAVGAVNCVTVERQATSQSGNQAIRLIGHNTDAPAFQETLQVFIQSNNQAIRQSFILGTGGAARAVAYALGALGIEYTFVSRHPDQHEHAISYEELVSFTSHLSPLTLIVNATPVGMYPAVDATPLDLSPFTQALKHSDNQAILIYDLIYNPSPTRLLREAATLGAQAKDGLEMLHRQAELSWEWFRQAE